MSVRSKVEEMDKKMKKELKVEKNQKRMYNRWAVSSGTPEDVSKCIQEVFDLFGPSHQCSRKRGHGKEGLYCKQHDPERIKAKEDARMAEAHYKIKIQRERSERRIILSELAKGISTEELSLYELTLKKV